jgi:hypothetical protein
VAARPKPEQGDHEHYGYVLDYYELALWCGDAAWLRKEKSRQTSEARSQRNLAAGFLFMGVRNGEKPGAGKDFDARGRTSHNDRSRRTK